MKLVQINTTCGVGSTGTICVEISKLLTDRKIENYILYSARTDGYALGISCANGRYTSLQALKSRLLGNYGFHSRRATRRMIAALEKIRPDIVHIHNIHGHDCHFGMLFRYLREKHIKVVYTFHDCWAFTGYCPHFAMAKCDKWRSGCGGCPLYRQYSWFFDKSAKNLAAKREALLGLDLTVVTPSRWLADMVAASFLKDVPVKVIHNGIDLSVFKPTPSAFREENGLADKIIVLGVAFDWGARKGLDVFVELARRLPEEYKIVLVGTNDAVDKQLPANILSIHRTQNATELAELYTAADVFVNPTREEAFGLVNVEALACGTPGVTFRTGGSPECYDDTCGSVVACDDIPALEREIRRICEERPYSAEACLRKALEFDKNERFKEYVALYEGIDPRGAEEDRA